MNAPPPRPYGLLAELTHRCPLHCPYCSNPVQLVPRGDELSEALWIDALDQAAALGVLQVGFSGGEPLLHPGLPQLVAAAKKAGLYSNLITSGVGLTSPRAHELHQAGLDTAQVSFQSDDPETGDPIAGARVHAQKLAATQALRDAGIPWSANVVLHRHNIGRISSIISLVRELGAIRIELANTQFYGWAFRNRAELLPTRQQIGEARSVMDQARRSLNGAMQIVYVLPDYFERRPKPCLHGWASRGMTINPRGDVLPCQAAESIPNLGFDNIRNRSLAAIWERGEAFNRFRGTEWMPEPCQSCQFREVDF
ncbi:MAG TPA: pyrroloquinoline quinone biosynthesis protein PqqE, partial [Candidatus Methylacidiphilales bacterium]